MSTARSFNGTSDYLATATSYLSSSAGPFTIMCWMKSTDLTQASYCLDCFSAGVESVVAYGLVNDGAGHSQVELYSTAGTFRPGSQITILNTNWHHVCYRYVGAGGEWAYFLDGVKTVISANLTGILNASTNFYVGANQGTGAFFSGSLAEVALWSTNLTDANIVAIANVYGATRPSDFTTNLLGYWPLGLASPDTDLSSANHPLTVVGTTSATGPYLGPLTLGLQTPTVSQPPIFISTW